MKREAMMVWEGLIISDGKIGFYSPKHKHHAIDLAQWHTAQTTNPSTRMLIGRK